MSNPLILDYEESNPDAKETILLVHGFPLDNRMWSAQLKGLPAHYRVIAPTLRARGQSPASEDAWSLSDHADDLAATLDHLNISKVHLVGLSMGGYILFEFWRRHAERLLSLVFTNTRAKDDPPEGKIGRETVAKDVLAQGSQILTPIMLPKLLAPNASQEVKDLISQMISQTPAQTTAHDALAMRDRPDSTADLASIQLPTLVIHGAEDTLIPPTEAQSMAKMLPHGRLELILGVGHMSPMEAPDEFNRILVEFVA
ncbi:alpha/beta fold hydrolase [Myxococcota bacterium]|nr:alpha/beta fold hydrolase [Myxococcota bacterium]